jgi:hypothetical protein
MRVAFVLVVLVAAAFSGCLVGHRSSAPDADNDQLPDEVEQKGWNITIMHSAATCFDPSKPRATETRHVTSDPMREDTDGDGLTDFQEFLVHSNPRSNDTDGDVIPDKVEFDLRSDPRLFAGARMALNDVDSDGDCIPDGDEVHGVNVPGIGIRVLDPTNSNTDGDGWDDPKEVYQTHTDPTKADTDGDGADDSVDADPFRDVWIRWDLQKITVKSSPKPNPNLMFDYNLPTEPPTVRPKPLPWFRVNVGQETPIPANNTPGLFNLDDRRGNQYAYMDLNLFRVNAQGLAEDTVDINPDAKTDSLTIRLDVRSGKWAFNTPSGTSTYGPEGMMMVLDTPTARLQFALVAQGPPT